MELVNFNKSYRSYFKITSKVDTTRKICTYTSWLQLGNISISKNYKRVVNICNQRPTYLGPEKKLKCLLYTIMHTLGKICKLNFQLKGI